MNLWKCSLVAAFLIATPLAQAARAEFLIPAELPVNLEEIRGSETVSGTLWIVGLKGLYRREDNLFIPVRYDCLEGIARVEAVPDSESQEHLSEIWVEGCDQRIVWKWEPGDQDSPEGRLVPPEEVSRSLGSGDEPYRILFFEDRGVYLVQGDQSGQVANSAARTDDGWWVASESGLTFQETLGEQKEPFLYGRTVGKMVVVNNAAWIIPPPRGTTRHGAAFRFRVNEERDAFPEDFLNGRDPIPVDGFTAMSKVGDEVWFGKSGGEILRWREGQVVEILDLDVRGNVTVIEKMSSAVVIRVSGMRGDTIFFGGIPSGGLQARRRIEDTDLKKVHHPRGIVSTRINRFELADGKVWGLAPDKLYRLESRPDLALDVGSRATHWAGVLFSAKPRGTRLYYADAENRTRGRATEFDMSEFEIIFTPEILVPGTQNLKWEVRDGSGEKVDDGEMEIHFVSPQRAKLGIVLAIVVLIGLSLFFLVRARRIAGRKNQAGESTTSELHSSGNIQEEDVNGRGARANPEPSGSPEDGSGAQQGPNDTGQMAATEAFVEPAHGSDDSGVRVTEVMPPDEAHLDAPHGEHFPKGLGELVPDSERTTVPRRPEQAEAGVQEGGEGEEGAGRFDFDQFEEIGGGSMGVVYRAVRKRTNKAVALKLVRQGAMGGSTERLVREAGILRKLDHPNVVKYYSATLLQEEEVPSWIKPFSFYLEMELLSGRNLRHIVTKDPALWRRIAKDTLVQVAEGLVHVHSKGVVHRDLKPSNIFVTEPSHQPKIIDFGIAKVLGPSGGTQLLGTEFYAAPEQMRGDGSEIGYWTDVYGFGGLMTETLSSGFALGAFGKKRSLSLVPVDTLSDFLLRCVSPECAALILLCMGEDPRSRPRMSSVLARLKEMSLF